MCNCRKWRLTYVEESVLNEKRTSPSRRRHTYTCDAMLRRVVYTQRWTPSVINWRQSSGEQQDIIDLRRLTCSCTTPEFGKQLQRKVYTLTFLEIPELYLPIQCIK